MLECCLTFRERNRPPFMNEFLGSHLLTHRPLTPQLSAIATGLRTSDVLLWLTPHHTLTRFHYSVNRKGLGYEAELTCCERADVRSRLNLAVHQGVDEARVAALLRTFITVIPALQRRPWQAALGQAGRRRQ